jgi:hypothetical protein
MGRGRAKAKQTKVARQLKYGGPATDLERLQAELAGTSAHDEDEDADIEADDYDDPYARYVDDEDDEDPGRDQGRPS